MNASTHVSSHVTVVLVKHKSFVSHAVFFCVHEWVRPDPFGELYSSQLCRLVRSFSRFLYRGSVHCMCSVHEDFVVMAWLRMQPTLCRVWYVSLLRYVECFRNLPGALVLGFAGVRHLCIIHAHAH